MPANFFPDLKNVATGGVSVTPQTIASATTTNGAALDMQKSDDTVHLFALTGDCGDATLTLDIKLQEAKEDPASPGNPLASDWSDMVGELTATAAIAELAGATAADKLMLIVGSRKRAKRFVRAVVITAGGGTLSVPISVAVLGRLKIAGAAGYTNLPTA